MSSLVFDSPQVWLPFVNTALIVISGVCLAVGYVLIRRKNVRWHRRSMISASVFAALFLVVYIGRYLTLGSKLFPGEGVSRVIYLTILIPHTIIAIAVAPLAFVTLRRALSGRFAQHRRIARITLPLWIWTAVSGWVVYMMLYAAWFQ